MLNALILAAAGCFGPATRVDVVPDRANSLAIEGNVLYCGADSSLYVFDVSEALRPKLLTTVPGIGHLRQLAVENGWVAVASRSGGAWLVDARDPAKARVACHFETVEQATGIDLCGNLLMVGQRGNGVEFVDITDRRHPEHIRMVKTPESQTVLYQDGYVYSGDWHAGATTIIDARDLSQAKVIAATEMQGLGDGLDLDGKLIYASTGHHRLRGPHKKHDHPDNWGAGHGLEIWDRSDLSHPRFVSRTQFPKFWRLGNDMWTVRASAGWAFCADTYNGLFAVDVKDPSRPQIVDRFCVPNPKDKEAPSFCVTYLAVGRGAVYATTDGGGLWVVPCPVARPRARVRGTPLPDVSWRDRYPTRSPRLEAWQPPARGQVHSVAGFGAYLYAGCSHAGSYVIDRQQLKTVGRIPCAYARDVYVRGNRLFVAQGDEGLGIYSLDDPAHPREVARVRDFGQDVTRCEWVYVPTARWAVCAGRVKQLWHFIDLEARPAACRTTVHNLGWLRPFADELVGGKWLGYAHTHDFFKWFDLSGEVPRCLDTTDPNAKGPLKSRPNALMSQAGCNAVHGKILLANGAGFVWLEPGQDRNADGSPWPFVRYAKMPEGVRDVRYTGTLASDGNDLVLKSDNHGRQLQLLSVRDEQKPELVWAEPTIGFPENPVFCKDAFYVPCGYQGLLRIANGTSEMKGEKSK